MAYKIATEQYAYNIGVGKGTPTSNLMVTYARAIALGCSIRNNSYSNTQLVRLLDLWSCSCLGATGSYNDCGSNCSCNSCNANNSYTWSCSCNSCNANNSYTWSCSCNSCNANTTYSYTCSCNSCNSNNSYCSCVAVTPIYCSCNSHSGTKPASCSCHSNTATTSWGCSCVTGIGKYCSTNRVSGTSCGGFSSILLGYGTCNSVSSNTCSSVVFTCSSNSSSNVTYYVRSYCSMKNTTQNISSCGGVTHYYSTLVLSATCGSHTCSTNGACSAVACSCNTCNTDTTCSSKTTSCSVYCSGHTNSAACGNNNEYKSCTCYSNVKNATGSCSCHTNTKTGTSSCSCHTNTKTGTSSCSCYSNVKCSCNGNWVTCSSKNYKEGTNS